MEFFVPAYLYPQGYRVSVSDGRWEADAQAQILRYFHSQDRERHTITVRPA
jgi:hypothetical protein